MKLNSAFMSEHDIQLSNEFIGNGYVIRDVEQMDLFFKIRSLITQHLAKFFNNPVRDEDIFLNNAHKLFKNNILNDVRLGLIREMAQSAWLRPAYYHLVKSSLETLIGNELAMQLRINLSIQMPGDTSSLLPVHADVWSGDSPYELVVWLPLVHCYETKSMYILPPNKADDLNRNFSKFVGKSSEDLFLEIKNDVIWLDIKPGQVLIFNQNLPHGNRINKENETRWSMNCRFKSLFTPYGDKKIGEFFEPISLRAASKIGMDYQLPRFDSMRPE